MVITERRVSFDCKKEKQEYRWTREYDSQKKKKGDSIVYRLKSSLNDRKSTSCHQFLLKRLGLRLSERPTDCVIKIDQPRIIYYT